MELSLLKSFLFDLSLLSNDIVLSIVIELAAVKANELFCYNENKINSRYTHYRSTRRRSASCR